MPRAARRPDTRRPHAARPPGGRWQGPPLSSSSAGVIYHTHVASHACERGARRRPARNRLELPLPPAARAALRARVLLPVRDRRPGRPGARLRDAGRTTSLAARRVAVGRANRGAVAAVVLRAALRAERDREPRRARRDPPPLGRGTARGCSHRAGSADPLRGAAGGGGVFPRPPRGAPGGPRRRPPPRRRAGP